MGALITEHCSKELAKDMGCNVQTQGRLASGWQAGNFVYNWACCQGTPALADLTALSLLISLNQDVYSSSGSH